MVEKLSVNGEIDSNREIAYETEKQYVVIHPETVEHYKSSPEIQVIEQLHLSHPDEAYNLRLRETVTSDGVSYTATLKDRGTITPEGLWRQEIETPITPETYLYYKSSGAHPLVRKLRAEPEEGVTIDWCEGMSLPILEIEGQDSKDFFNRFRESLVERTGSPELSSEYLAHQLSPNLMPPIPERITPHEILARIMELHRSGTTPIVVGISGRSGSGKTTIAKALLELATAHRLETAHISTDDYHRGKTWLESTYQKPWTNWDAPEVYDTQQLNFDLFQLAKGIPINSYRFDLPSEERVTTGKIQPSELVVIEGIYAGSPDLQARLHLHVAVPTPLATSIGQRIRRDSALLNESFASPAAILRYQLEVAEPTYRQQS